MVGYNCPPARLLFDLKPVDQAGAFYPWPLTGALPLTTAIRDAAAQRLKDEMPEAVGNIDRAPIGSKGACEVDKVLRVRIIPLPSIGMTHTDPSIRRVLVERLPDCPVRTEAFAEGSRFPARRLSHVRITFSAPLSGPLVIGDGRYCGLGILAPLREVFRDALIPSVGAPATALRSRIAAPSSPPCVGR